MDPKPIDNELLKQEEDGARAPRRRQQRVPDFPFNFIWWLTDPDVLALTRDEQAGFMKVFCTTLNSPRPGIMAEEQVRVWAGYTPEEWTAHQVHFLPLFRVRPDGTWTMTVLRTVFLAQQRRLQKARKGAVEANRKRWENHTIRAARIRSGRSPDAKSGIRGIRNDSLCSQDSKKESSPVPMTESPTGAPGIGALSGPAPGQVRDLIHTVTAGLVVRGRSGA
jgi:hypothetical protein